MALKIFGYTVPPALIVIVILFLFTTPSQKSSLLDSAKQICNLPNTITISLTDSFISTVKNPKTREQLLKLKSMGEISLNVAENVELLEDLYEKKKIRLSPGCVIVGAI